MAWPHVRVNEWLTWTRSLNFEGISITFCMQTYLVLSHTFSLSNVTGYIVKAKYRPPMAPMKPNIEILSWKSQEKKPGMSSLLTYVRNWIHEHFDFWLVSCRYIQQFFSQIWKLLQISSIRTVCMDVRRCFSIAVLQVYFERPARLARCLFGCGNVIIDICLFLVITTLQDFQNIKTDFVGILKS